MVNLDILIIGAGTAGEYAAGTAKQSFDSVGMIEKGPVGGDCIFHACIPTKALVHAARTYKKMKSADFYGLPAIDNTINYKEVKAFKDRIIRGIGTGRDERWIKSGIKLFKGNARFISPHPRQLESYPVPRKYALWSQRQQISERTPPQWDRHQLWLTFAELFPVLELQYW